MAETRVKICEPKLDIKLQFVSSYAFSGVETNKKINPLTITLHAIWKKWNFLLGLMAKFQCFKTK